MYTSKCRVIISFLTIISLRGYVSVAKQLVDRQVATYSWVNLLGSSSMT